MKTSENIIDDGANLIGNVENVVEYLKGELIKQIEDIDFIAMESNDVENVQDNCTKTMELINGLFQDYITEEISSDTIIKVNYDNNFDDLLYTIYKEDKQEETMDMVEIGHDFQEKEILNDLIKKHWNITENIFSGEYCYSLCNIHKDWKKWDKDVYKMSDGMCDSMTIYISLHENYIEQELRSWFLIKKDNN